MLPIFYWGTERERPTKKLLSFGFKEGDYIFGVDFPGNPLKSLYAREEFFSLLVREMLDRLARQDYKLIVIVNGHGSLNQAVTLDRLCSEFFAECPANVVWSYPHHPEPGSVGGEHACIWETSIMLYIKPESVDLGSLPPRDKPLYVKELGIFDRETSLGNPTPDFSIRDDPRDATAEAGREFFEDHVRRFSEWVLDLLKDIKP